MGFFDGFLGLNVVISDVSHLVSDSIKQKPGQYRHKTALILLYITFQFPILIQIFPPK